MQSENPIIADFVRLANSAAGTLAGMAWAGIVALLRDSSETNPAAQRAIGLLLEAARGVDESRAA